MIISHNNDKKVIPKNLLYTAQPTITTTALEKLYYTGPVPWGSDFFPSTGSRDKATEMSVVPCPHAE